MDESRAPTPLRPNPQGFVPTVTSTEDAPDGLVERARRGDGRAWARLYQLHFDRVFRDVAYLVGATAQAEEIVQETFAAALVGLRRYDGRASFETWLRGIAHNLVRRHWRTRFRRGRAYDRLEQMAAEPPGSPREDPEQSHVQDRRAEVLRAVLETLPESMREAFVLCDVQGLSAAEAAERLGITEGNVRVRASRARGLIRSELERLGWLEPTTGGGT
jgi:RNA polymerase sigma-70 factor (ECF subfamily)